jgi:O-acetyl-ADP-ribose deacetylase (regulator of RNase III)
LDRFDQKIEEDKIAREKDPARMQAWKNALTAPAKSRPVKLSFAGSEEVEKSLAALAQDRTKEHLVQCLEALRKAMHAGGHVLFPVQPFTPQGGAKTPARALRVKLLSTKDGRTWQVAYTSEGAYKSGRSAKEPAMGAPIRKALEQYTAQAPAGNRAPDKINGIVLNPEKNPLFLDRKVIEQIMKVEEAAKRAAKSGILVTKGDITKVKADCIVNAANTSLLGGGGVDGAIHRAAGPGLLAECRTLDGCHTGEAKITGGYNLPAKYVIHTVGPIYDGDEEDPILLASCYTNSLELARQKGLHSIVFPNISTGVYGYPKAEAAQIAMNTVGKWLAAHKDYVMHVVMCCFDQENYALYEKIVKDRGENAPKN